MTRAVPRMPREVGAAFAGFPADARTPLRRLRALIFEESERLAVGPLTETLKWGEPAYLTEATRAGSTIRLGCPRGTTNGYAAYFICQTTIVQDVRDRFGGMFRYEKNRAVIGAIGEPLPEDAWRACFAMALTYKRR